MMHRCLFVLLVYCASSISSAFKLPNYVKTCRRSDPDLNKCLSEAVAAIKPHLTEGIPEMSIPACEPLLIPKLDLKIGTGPIAFSSHYKDVHVWGLTEFILKNLRINLTNKTLDVSTSLSKLWITANYAINGTAMHMPIKGVGICSGNFSNIETNMTIYLKEIIINGSKHLICDDANVDFEIGKAEINLGNLFDGNEQLGEFINTMLNKNFKSLQADLKPMIDKIMTNLIMQHGNSFFEKVPLDVLLPE